MKKLSPVWMIFFLVFAIVGPSMAQSPEETATIVIKVTGIRSDLGVIRAHLFSSEDDFPEEKKAWRHTKSSKIREGTSVLKFSGLPHGKWAVTVHHDEDNDGKMKTNWIGMPKEGVGASLNPKGRPKFKTTMFFLGGDRRFTIKLKYL